MFCSAEIVRANWSEISFGNEIGTIRSRDMPFLRKREGSCEKKSSNNTGKDSSSSRMVTHPAAHGGAGEKRKIINDGTAPAHIDSRKAPARPKFPK
jgi:hypothetical protein